MRPFFAVLLVGLALLIGAAVVGVASRSADTTPVLWPTLLRLACHRRQA